MKYRGKIFYLGLPILGVLFYLIYLHMATVDIIYSDYIRLINSYLPDVWNPKKFFVADLLTRIPINYLERGINVTFFGYSVTFDRVMGVLGFGLSAMLAGGYCQRKKIGAGWYLALVVFTFSLNKWEMLYNGTGWVHFLAFACFYYNYLVVDRFYGGEGKRGDLARMLLLPAVITIFVAGPYCAIYLTTLVLTYGFIWVRNRWILCGGFAGFRKKRKSRGSAGREYAASSSAGQADAVLSGMDTRRLCSLTGRQLALLAVMAVWPFLVYLWSHFHAVYQYSGATELTLKEALLTQPLFFAKFFLKSFASMVLGTELITGKLPNVPGKVWCLLGALVILAYLLALWMNFYYRLVDQTLFPLMMLAGGAMNHMMVFISRWIFIPNDIYGMSSRYALQYQIGIVGMFLTFALSAQESEKRRAQGEPERTERLKTADGKTADGKTADGKTGSREAAAGGNSGRDRLVYRLTLVIAAVFVAGNVATTVNELNFAKHRKVHNQYNHKLVWDFETESDEILERKLEYSKDGLREALTILKENHLNIFGQDPPYYPEILDREPD